MSTPARKRLMRDFRKLNSDPPPGVNASPNSDNVLRWNAIIFGPDGTPWEGGTFSLTLEFSEEYPNKAPVVKFKTSMFHPNIYTDGGICLDILQNQWSPIYDVAAVLISIQSLLGEPNPNSPANGEAARMFVNDKREYNKRVREVVEASLVQNLNHNNQKASTSSAAPSAATATAPATAPAPPPAPPPPPPPPLANDPPPPPPLANDQRVMNPGQVNS